MLTHNKSMIYGYYGNPEQTEPVYEPGLEVDCPICHQQISRPMWTISLMLIGDERSYFYRVHKACYDPLTSDEKGALDEILIDAVAATKNTN